MKTEEVTRTDVKELFKLFRKEGYHCRMRFSCCTGCASGEASDLMKPKHKGHVSYNRQDHERVFQTGWHGAQTEEMQQRLYLLWGVNSNDDPETEARQMEMGRELCKIMESAGFAFQWDGDPDTKIALLPVRGI